MRLHALALFAALAALASSAHSDTLGIASGLVLQPMFPNLDTRPPGTALPENFTVIHVQRVRLPTLTPGVASAPTWVVALRNGRMFVVRDTTASAASTPLLRDVDPSWANRDLSFSEEGYFALAFDPDAGTDPTRAFAYYTSGRFGGVDLMRAPIDTVPRAGGGFDWTFGAPTLVMRVDAGGHHYGGDLRFGADGFLYFSTGENDIFARSQSPRNTMGKVLRLDVHQSGLTANYGVPGDNPWRLNGGAPNPPCPTTTGGPDYPHDCPEVYAVGFRNPFRFTFDREGGALWLADVGAAHEEIDRVTIGANFGWNTCEGTSCGTPGIMPAVITIPRQGCTQAGYAVIGGFVYRGSAMPSLRGKYVAGDNAAGKLWLVDDPYGTPSVSNLYNGNCADAGFHPSAFHEDEDGELYVASLNSQPGAGVFRIALRETIFADGFE